MIRPYEKIKHPDHYQSENIEAIDVIEDVIRHAPDPVSGMLLGNTLKYLLRVWFKACPHQDAKKARWYLDRLIQHLESEQAAELYKRLEDNPAPFDDPLQ